MKSAMKITVGTESIKEACDKAMASALEKFGSVQLRTCEQSEVYDNGHFGSDDIPTVLVMCMPSCEYTMEQLRCLSEATAIILVMHEETKETTLSRIKKITSAPFKDITVTTFKTGIVVISAAMKQPMHKKVNKSR